MRYVGHFTLLKDEAFGDYHIDTSQNLTRQIRTTWNLRKKTGAYISAKMFKKKTGVEFTLLQKVNFTQEELRATGKST